MDRKVDRIVANTGTVDIRSRLDRIAEISGKVQELCLPGSSHFAAFGFSKHLIALAIKYVSWFVLEPLTQRLVGFVLQELLTVGYLAEQVIEAGNHEDTNHGTNEHPADRGNRGPMGTP